MEDILMGKQQKEFIELIKDLEENKTLEERVTMKLNDTTLGIFFNITRKTVARLRKSEILKDKIYYDGLVAHFNKSNEKLQQEQKDSKVCGNCCNCECKKV